MPDQLEADENQPFLLDRRGFLKWGALAASAAEGAKAFQLKRSSGKQAR